MEAKLTQMKRESIKWDIVRRYYSESCRKVTCREHRTEHRTQTQSGRGGCEAGAWRGWEPRNWKRLVAPLKGVKENKRKPRRGPGTLQ